RGAAELLAENPPAPDRARFVANLRAETDRLQLIVERLLELAALESRRAGAQMAPLDLAALVREAHATALAAANLRGVAFALEIGAASAGGRGVRGEKFLLAQAIGNLVQNALEFTPRGGTVTLALDVAGERAQVSVSDTGPGIPDY